MYFKDRAILRLSRNLSEICNLRKCLVNNNDKIIKSRSTAAGALTIEEDGNEELVGNVHCVVSLVESIEDWMNKLFASIPFERCKCKQLIEFFTPTEADYYVMETELMVEGGFASAWKQT